MKMKKILITMAIVSAAVLGFGAQKIRAQSPDFQFLGPPHQVADQFSPRHHIRYNTQGYDRPDGPSLAQIKKMKKKHVPDEVIDQILAFPGTGDAIGNWVDEAFDQAKDEFIKCGGTLAARANQISPQNLYVLVMPSGFYEPYYKIYVAGAYYPATKEIKALALYYHWKGENKGWLRQIRDLLVWEMENYFGDSVGIVAEPRPQGWPCTGSPKK